MFRNFSEYIYHENFSENTMKIDDDNEKREFSESPRVVNINKNSRESQYIKELKLNKIKFETITKIK